MKYYQYPFGGCPMLKLTRLFFICVIVAGSTLPAFAQSAQTFKLQKGQAMRITPEGKVDVFAKMQGDPAHIREMEKRGQPITKGLAIWVGNGGKLRFLTDPVEDAEHMRR
jgi:hypothetical protein